MLARVLINYCKLKIIKNMHTCVYTRTYDSIKMKMKNKKTKFIYIGLVVLKYKCINVAAAMNFKLIINTKVNYI